VIVSAAPTIARQSGAPRLRLLLGHAILPSLSGTRQLACRFLIADGSLTDRYEIASISQIYFDSLYALCNTRRESIPERHAPATDPVSRQSEHCACLEELAYPRLRAS